MHIQLNTNQPASNINIFKGDKNEILPVETIDVRSITSEPVKKIQKTYQTTSAAAVAAIGTVAILFTMSKGFQKNTNVLLNKFKDYLETKLARTSINDSKKRGSFYEFVIRRINSFIHKSESINNITSLKDILFMKFMYETKPTKKIHEAITKYFEKISEKTVLKSYEKTERLFNKMNKIFDELDEYILKNSADDIVEYEEKVYTKQGVQTKIVKKTKQELLSEAKNLRDLSNVAIEVFINKSTIKSRYDYINKATSSLYSTFWDASFKDFWSKNNKFKRKEMWQTFIAAEQIRPNKTFMADCSSTIKNAVSYSGIDQIVSVNEYIKALDIIIPPADTEGIEIIDRLKWFVKNPEIFEKNKDLFFKELNKLKEHKFPQNPNSKINEQLEEYKQEHIAHIDKQINDNSPGMFQEMLAYYYKMAPYELEKSGALLSLKKAVKSLDKSIDLEGNEFFDKVRDLRLGSAPTDILTILVSFAALTLGLGHAQDRDKRTSIMLKSGIPIVGGIATAMFSAAKLVSGGKSLALGFISGIVLNQLGVIADNIRIRLKEKENV